MDIAPLELDKRKITYIRMDGDQVFKGTSHRKIIAYQQQAGMDVEWWLAIVEDGILLKRLNSRYVVEIHHAI